MGDAKFTPGPWRVGFGLDTWPRSCVEVRSANCRVASVNDTHHQREVGDRFLTGDEVDADAHLISAAPDLYAALEWLVGDIDVPPHRQFITRAISHDDLVKAKAALAKARGL